ncbi:hypothetical protein FQA39_LY01160 [Lamprigera yunnana]|nr:hypothetical protein FQA39_LY01160 [Lamprigera yunnana]
MYHLRLPLKVSKCLIAVDIERERLKVTLETHLQNSAYCETREYFKEDARDWCTTGISNNATLHVTRSLGAVKLNLWEYD